MRIYRGEKQIGDFHSGRFTTTDTRLLEYIKVREYETRGCPQRYVESTDTLIKEMVRYIPLIDETVPALLADDLRPAGYRLGV